MSKDANTGRKLSKTYSISEAAISKVVEAAERTGKSASGIIEELIAEMKLPRKKRKKGNGLVQKKLF